MKTFRRLTGFLSNLTSSEVWHHQGNPSAPAHPAEWFLRDELERQLIDKDTRRPY